MNDLTLLIPANKEAESLPVFLTELKRFNFKKLIVLQKEDQETFESISNFDDIDFHYQDEKGYGNALVEGINKINTKYFCIINADGSMDPAYLEEMLKLCLDKDFVFASRYLPKGGSDDDNLITYIGNHFFSMLGNIFFQLNISDILYTYVMGKTKSAKELNLNSKDFRFCVELPIKAKKKDMIFCDTPSKERKRIGGKKKVNAFKDGFLILLGMVKLFFYKK